ncbi:hypothetical protein GCM10010272_00470 [Streptomyces lateritius]|nr:hypothetical protein GCM10010272_00470 [Streptomyces lateritius]
MTGMVSVCPVPALVLILVLLATVAVTVVIATTNRLLAGGVIMSFAMLRLSFRLANRSPQTWTSMKFHIKAEMFFQSVAMVSLGVAAALMISGIPNKGYELAPRVALSATLVLASVIAANRTASRGRKVCTRIWSDVKDVVRAQEVLRLAAGDGGERLKKIQEFKECVDSLEAALRTCFDTGYRMLGTTVLPEKEIEALIERLGRLPDVYDAGSLEWMDAKEDLTRVSAACHPWIDVAA